MAVAVIRLLAALPASGQEAGGLARFEEAWSVADGDGVTVAVVGEGDLADEVVTVVAAGAPGAAVASVGDLDAAAGAGVVVLAAGELGWGERLASTPGLADAVTGAAEGGAVVVVPAGSEGRRDAPPAPDLPVVVVGAVTATGQARPYDNVNDRRTLSAVGAASDPALDGTSVAAGRVGAAAALLLSLGRPAVDVGTILADSAANPFGDARIGAGWLDAATAVTSTAAAVPAAAAPAGLPPPDGTAGGPARRPEAAGGSPVDASTARDLVLLLVAVAAAVIVLDLRLGATVLRRRRSRGVEVVGDRFG